MAAYAAAYAAGLRSPTRPAWRRQGVLVVALAPVLPAGPAGLALQGLDYVEPAGAGIAHLLARPRLYSLRAGWWCWRG